MAQLLVIPDKKYHDLAGMIGGDKIVVLMPQSLATKHGIQDGDERFADYICGEDADVWVDFAGRDDHFAFSHIEEQG